MTNKTCLRCDWEGETQEAGCPDCESQPLYVLVAPPTASGGPPQGRPDERGGGTAVTIGTPRPRTGSLEPVGAPDADTGGSSTRSLRSVVALVLVALVLIVILGTWLEPSPTIGGARSPSRSPSPSTPDVAPVVAPIIRRQTQTAGPVTISFSAPRLGWEWHDRFSMNRSVVGPQGAEAVIFWTSFPDGGLAHPCARVLDPPGGAGAADLAAAVAQAPGTDLISGPSDVVVGGRPAKRVVLGVRESVGCGPGFFYAWDEMNGGALWGTNTMAETIRVWTLEVAGTLVFIEAQTTDQATLELEQEIRRIVGSTRFETIRRPTGSTVAIAERFMRARNAYDAETALSLLDHDGVTARLVEQQNDGTASNMPTVRLGPGKLVLALKAERLYGVRYRSIHCRPSRAGAFQVICSYQMDNRLRQLKHRSPVESSVALRIRHGRIDYLSFPWLNVGFDPGGSYPSEFGSFVRWLEVEHPDAGGPVDHGDLFRPIGQELVLNLTEESLDLLRTYLDEYERSLGL
jgi:hypothetical protein